MNPVALDEASVPQEVKDSELKVAIEKTKEEQINKAVEAALKKAGFNLYIAENEEHINEGIMKGNITEAQAEEIRKIKKETAEQKAANMPEQMVQNIAKGRMAKFFKDSCLLNQEYIQDSKMSVADYLHAADKELTVVAFKRFTAACGVSPGRLKAVFEITYDKASRIKRGAFCRLFAPGGGAFLRFIPQFVCMGKTVSSFVSVMASHVHILPGSRWCVFINEPYIPSKRFADEPERPSFAFRKAANRTPKGRLLQAERRPFANVLIVRLLQMRCDMVFESNCWRRFRWMKIVVPECLPLRVFFINLPCVTQSFNAMIKFKDVTVDDKDLIQSFTLYGERQNCDLSFANLISWRFLYNTQFAVVEDYLVFRFYTGPPLGLHDARSSPSAARGTVRSGWSRATNARQASSAPYATTPLPWGTRSSCLACATTCATSLEKHFPDTFCIKPDRDYSDYVYLRDKLVSLSGKKLQSKRNHINKFKSLYPDYEYRELTPDLIPQCLEVERQWRAVSKADNGGEPDEELSVELRSMTRAFNRWDKLGLTGGAIFVDGRMVAFTYGCPINQTTFDGVRGEGRRGL